MYNVKSGEQYAKITITDAETVKFSDKWDVFGVKGDDITVKLNSTDTGDGVYNTDDTGGAVIIAHGRRLDTMYLTGTGDVIVWAGASAVDCPFKPGAKGGGSGGDNTHYKGTTTTPISNGSTTNPITIDGESYTAVFGDIAVYNYTEFVFDGTQWSEFGRPFDTTPTSESANAVTSDGVYKNTAGKKYYSNNTLKGEIFNDYTNNKATGNYSHAEGYYTKATGNYSHAEGYYTKATGDMSHAEGRSTTASGESSHAEGYFATASGNVSHAEGYYTKATGDMSYAVGEYTIASQRNMTAIGKYNNARSGDLFNIGNGTGGNNRSNILEANSTSVNVNGNIQRDGVGIDDYTTTERKIGKWIDGSDLYQRTFEVTPSRLDGWNDNVLGTSGIKIVDVHGFIYGWYTDDYLSKPLVYYRGPTDFITLTYNSDVSVYISDLAVRTSPMPTLTITIKYTKPSAQDNLMQTPIPTEEVSETPTVEEDDMR